MYNTDVCIYNTGRVVVIAPDVGLREFTFDGAFPGKGTLGCMCICVYMLQHGYVCMLAYLDMCII